MKEDFKFASHTLILSDIHLADAEPNHPRKPLWKRFKQSQHFIDQSFKNFLEQMQNRIGSPIELILNGDIFDFDSVMTLPSDLSIQLNWLERARGLNSEEEKSRFKMSVILGFHPVWVEAIRNFVLAGNRIIFVIGNHDLELHWPSVQQYFLRQVNLPEELQSQIRFCEWFYISNQDTLIEHGNQYDAYCLCSNPIHPLIKKGSKILVRLPFGNIAGRYMINGIGLMNPHTVSSFIKDSFWEYFMFYYKYVIRIQPFLMWTWFWGALVTLVNSLTDGFLPAMRDPLTVDSRIEEIARKANASVLVVVSLRTLSVHPAIFNPFKILQELWLDRVVILGMILFVSFEFFRFINVFAAVSLWWFIGPIILLLPVFVFYARSVQSEVKGAEEAAAQVAPLTARIVKVKRVVHGHTHHEFHGEKDGMEILNSGTWSPAFLDVECTQPFGRKCFVWIKPSEFEGKRVAELYEWKDTEAEIIPKTQ
jgi:UDP-2,3-diacylglucosamine pyrophosphatase LpxH